MSLKVLSIIVAAGLPYMFTLKGDFVFDDTEAIITNRDLKSESWISPFYHDFWGSDITSNISHKSYRPLTILSFKLNYHLSGRKLVAKHFKITNFLCHITCCLLLYPLLETLISKLGKHKSSKDLAYLTTILFCVHPVHVEAVSGIVGRADLLAAIAFFSSLTFYIKGADIETSYRHIFIAVVLAGISMLFKENGVTVLGLCLVYDIIINVKKNKPGREKRVNIQASKQYQINFATVKRIVFVTLIIVLLLYGRWMVMGGKNPEFQPIDNPAAFSNDLFTRVATYSYVYFLNMLLLIWPQWLCYDWSMGCVPLVESLQDFRMRPLLLMLIYGMLTCVAVCHKNNRRTTKRLIIFAVSMIVVPFLPASNIFFPVGFVLAERVLYIPSAGYCLLVAVGLNKILHHKQYPRHYKVAVKMLWYMTLFMYCLRSYKRSTEWQSEHKLFISALTVCPLNAKVHYNVAKIADASDRDKWAIDEYKEAIRLYPEYYQAMNNLANLLKNYRQYDEAERHLRNALKYKEDFPAAWMNLGIVLASTKRYCESEACYRKALEYRKNYPDCLYNLGNLYLELNKTAETEKNWLLAISKNPAHNLAWTNLLAMWDNTGQLEKAKKLIPKALEILPESASLNFAVANIYGKLNRYELAETHFSAALRLLGGRAQNIHYGNFGVLYHRWKKYNLAEDMYKKALIVDPYFESAKKNLQTLEKIKKKNKKKEK